MTELERYIFEQSLLGFGVYKILSKLTFKKGKNNPLIESAKEKVEKILGCENSEIVKRASQVYITDEVTLYKLYRRFESDYLSSFDAYNFTNDSVTKNRCEFYDGVSEFVTSIMFFLLDSLNEYRGANRNVYMAGQGVLLLLKGLYIKSNLKSIEHFVPKPQKSLARISTTTDYFVEKLPDIIDNILFRCEKIAGINVEINTDATTLNTICPESCLLSIRSLLESTIITKKQAETLNDATNSSNRVLSGGVNLDENFEQNLIKKARVLFDDIPDEIYKITKKIEDTLVQEKDETLYFIEELSKSADYPEFYNVEKEDVRTEENKTEDVVEDIETQDSLKDGAIQNSEQNVVQSYNFEKTKKAKPVFNFSVILVFFKSLGLAIWNGVKGIGKFFWAIIKGIGLFFWKILKFIGKFFAELLEIVGRFLSKHKVVSIILGVIIVAAPIITFIVLHKPCHYENAVVTVHSTCETEGLATLTCTNHNKTKTISLPKKHTLDLTGTCTGCGATFGLHEDKYIPKVPEHSDVFMCMYGCNTLDTLTTVSCYEGQPFEEMLFDDFEAEEVTIYSHAELTINLRGCKIERLYIIGDVKNVNIDNKDVENIVIYGNVHTLSVKQRSKIDSIAIIGEAKYIHSEK